ncbi:CENP-B ARS binding protein-like protein, partial [Rhizoctonia solani]
MAMSQAPAAVGSPRHRLTFSQQLKVVDIYHRYKSLGPAEVLSRVRRAGFTTTCMQTINQYVRQEALIREFVAQHEGHSKRMARSNISVPEVERLLWTWIEDMERRNLRMNGEMIKAKARRTAIEIGIPPHEMIEFSEGWLTGFKRRYGNKERVFHGEAASAPLELIEPARKTLQDAIRHFRLQYVLNVDETAHNSCQVRNRGLASRQLSGVKLDKTRLTVVLATSAAGGKLPPLIIGHAA